MTLPNVDKVFVVSVAGRTTHRQRACAELSRMGLAHEVFDAFDGGALQLRTAVCSRYLKDRPLPTGRLGNYLSQIAIFRESVRRNYGNVLIVEDDACFCSRFIERAARAIADLPDEWDMLYFGVWDWNTRAGRPVSDAIYRPGRPLLRHAVLHSAKALPVLVEKTRKLTETIDVTISRLTGELNIYATRARLAWQAEGRA
jgi:GR25 family glycosyltransferase involved in LPS biosynthesis